MYQSYGPFKDGQKIIAKGSRQGKITVRITMPFLGNIHSPLRGRYIVIQTKGSQLNLKEVTIYGPGGYSTIFSCSNLLHSETWGCLAYPCKSGDLDKPNPEPVRVKAAINQKEAKKRARNLRNLGRAGRHKSQKTKKTTRAIKPRRPRKTKASKKRRNLRNSTPAKSIMGVEANIS